MRLEAAVEAAFEKHQQKRLVFTLGRRSHRRLSGASEPPPNTLTTYCQLPVGRGACLFTALSQGRCSDERTGQPARFLLTSSTYRCRRIFGERPMARSSSGTCFNSENATAKSKYSRVWPLAVASRSLAAAPCSRAGRVASPVPHATCLWWVLSSFTARRVISAERGSGTHLPAGRK